MTVDYTRLPALPQIPVQPQPPQQKSGCWKWGLIGCGALAVLFGGFVAVVVMFATGVYKETAVYRGAEHRVENDPRVIAALGSPLEASWWVTGSLHVDNGKGNADFSFGVQGPKGSAKVYVEATHDREAWTYTELTVKPDNGPSIDLLKP